LLKKWLRDKEYTSKLITKEDYDARVNFILRVKEGDIDCREHYLTGNLNAYKWLRKYYVFKYADSAVLVLRPTAKKSGAVDVTAMSMDNLQQPTFAERLMWLTLGVWRMIQNVIIIQLGYQSDRVKNLNRYHAVSIVRMVFLTTDGV